VSARLGIEAFAESDHGGARRHLGYCPESKPGGVIALMIEINQEVPTRQHHLGQCDHHPTEHETAIALLE